MIYFYQSVFYAEKLSDIGERVSGKLRVHGRCLLYTSESDCVLLCSDGLTNMVDDAEISRFLKTTDTLKEKTDALIDEANRNGGKDNIAIVLVAVSYTQLHPCTDRSCPLTLGAGTCEFHVLQILESPQHDRDDGC